ncbi:hypothetical protein Csa_009243, partial [Cucumis sativus]
NELRIKERAIQNTSAENGDFLDEFLYYKRDRPFYRPLNKEELTETKKLLQERLKD